MPVFKDDNTNKQYFYTRYKDVYGNNNRKVKRGFRTKREAKTAENSFLLEIERGYSVSNTYDYIFKHYLDNTDLMEKTKKRESIQITCERKIWAY